MSKFDDVGVMDRSLVWGMDLIAALELKNMLNCASSIMYDAENRNESHGAHAHQNDLDHDDENWMEHTLELTPSSTPLISLLWMRSVESAWRVVTDCPLLRNLYLESRATSLARRASSFSEEEKDPWTV